MNTSSASPASHVKPPALQRILVGIDLSAASRQALDKALHIAQATGAEVHAVYSWAAPYLPHAVTSSERQATPHTLFDLVRAQCLQDVQQFVAERAARFPGVATQWAVESGDARTLLLDYANQHSCDWIVLGSRSGAAHWLLGSVAKFLLAHAGCPVLVVPPVPSSSTP